MDATVPVGCPVVSDGWDLERFVHAQDRTGGYARALAEIRAGSKDSHWIWWVFPQLAGLGVSSISRAYAITSLDEARAYLRHPILGARLREATTAMNAHVGRTAEAVLHWDAMKFRSCVTLFHRADPSEPVFGDALDLFFAGVADELTDQLLGATSS